MKAGIVKSAAINFGAFGLKGGIANSVNFGNRNAVAGVEAAGGAAVKGGGARVAREATRLRKKATTSSLSRLLPNSISPKGLGGAATVANLTSSLLKPNSLLLEGSLQIEGLTYSSNLTRLAGGVAGKGEPEVEVSKGE